MLKNMRIGPRMVLVGTVLLLVSLFTVTSFMIWKSEANVTALDNERLLAEVRDTRGPAILIALGAFIVCVVVYSLFSRSITAPLHDSMRLAEKVAAGDFTVRLEAKSRDEVGSLVRTLNAMAERLGSMVITVQQSADQVSAANGEISHSAQNLADGAQRQAATIEETSAAIEELTASVDQVADHARRQAAAVKDGAVSMASVRQSMEEVSASLTRIDELSKGSVARSLDGSQAVGKAIEGIAAISESSEKISGIITVITDIADQTNLLALNASIEAARAGEHGRGFAVVASEVSKLAERSAQAAKEIEALIRESTRNVEKGVQTSQGARGAMDEIQKSSKSVQEMIAALTRSMEQQVEGVTKLSGALTDVSDMSQNISAATDEQSRSMRQVATAVESISEITQSAAAAAEQMSSATDRVATMARDLQKTVDQLTVDAAVQRSTDYFPWTDELALGIRVIDQQHRRLVDMINELYRDMIDNAGTVAQKKVIAEMVDYAATHFALEEEYMRQFSFGGRDAHVKAHEAFVAKAKDLKQRSDTAGFVLSMEIVDFLKDWLQKHIMGTDRQYRDCFLKNGVV